MNYALIFAGGVGKRMENNKMPKQFLEIGSKPILIHTLEHFEKHPLIDGICLMVIKEWLDYTKQLIKKFGFKKVLFTLEGGKSALDTQYLGLKALNEYEKENLYAEGIVLIHDGVRPLINAQLITDCIESVKNYGSGVVVAPAIETIIRIDEKQNVLETIRRQDCMLARAPQSFYLNDILQLHDKCSDEERNAFIDSTSMMIRFNKHVKAVNGPAENIKITTLSDFYVCKAFIEAIKDDAL